MAIESSEGETRNRSWYGVSLADGTTVALDREDRFRGNP